jgi:hypothetical protein
MESFMKTASKLFAGILVVSSLSLSLAHAQTSGAQPATPLPQASPGGPMMGGTQDMQAAMQKMQEQMAKLRSTSDPTERQKLLTEHMSTMQGAMGTMMKMGGPGMGTMPGSGMMRGNDKKSSTTGPQDMRGRMGMMEQRMGMMQMMMDQMMQHQDMMDRRQ